jgi:membrane protein implicated in regulation of membrane protease activity
MSDYWMWWIAGAALIAAELVTGTFYLLVIGLALVCGGVAAWLGAAVPVQWLIAAALGVVGTVLLQRWKRGLAAGTPPQQGLDIGQMVQVQSWGPAGTARVAYRGSTWDAEVATPDTPHTKTMDIAGMRGSVLLLSTRPPETA